jgi:hypothetical protein
MYIIAILFLVIILFYMNRTRIVENIINLGNVCLNRPKEENIKSLNNPNLRMDRGGLV